MPKLFLPLLAIVLAGCTTEYQHLKMHDEPLPPGTQPALVKPASATVIREIDGKKVYFAPTALKTYEYELEFAPGEHTFSVGYEDGVRHAPERILRGELLPGRKYILKPDLKLEFWNGASWRPILLDVTDKPQCWTVWVGNAIGPDGC